MARQRRKITNTSISPIQIAGRWIQPGGIDTFDVEQLPSEWKNAGVAVDDQPAVKVPAMISPGSTALEVIRDSAQGIVNLDRVGQLAVRNASANLAPLFADEVISLSVSGCATALPCTLKRVRCSKVTGSPVQMTIYDDNNLSTGRVIWQGTLAQDADATDIPDVGLPAMTGLYCKWTGAAGDYNFHITVGASQ